MVVELAFLIYIVIFYSKISITKLVLRFDKFSYLAMILNLAISAMTSQSGLWGS